MKNPSIENCRNSKLAKLPYTDTASNKSIYTEENKENAPQNNVTWLHDVTHNKFYVSILNPNTSITLPKYDIYEVNYCPSEYVKVIKFRNDYKILHDAFSSPENNTNDDVEEEFVSNFYDDDLPGTFSDEMQNFL